MPWKFIAAFSSIPLMLLEHSRGFTAINFYPPANECLRTSLFKAALQLINNLLKYRFFLYCMFRRDLWHSRRRKKKEDASYAWLITPVPYWGLKVLSNGPKPIHDFDSHLKALKVPQCIMVYGYSFFFYDVKRNVKACPNVAIIKCFFFQDTYPSAA